MPMFKERLTNAQVAVDGIALELLPVGVALVGPDGEADWLNTRAAELLVEVPVEWAAEIAGRVRAGEIVREERLGLEESGVTLEVSAVPVTEPAGETLVIFTDLSRRERRERSERDFVANAAHQMRTPLTAIAVGLAALRAGAIDEASQRERFLGHLDTALERLTNATEALLTLARVQSGEPLARSIVPLEPVIERVVRGRRNVRVHCETGAAAVAHERLLAEALSNVLDNAHRHGGENPIDLTVAVADSRVHIEIRDRGPGIPPERRSELLGRFHGTGPGSGLGLAIAHEVLVAFEGSLTLGDAIGGGLVVAFELPGARLL
jgi:signal transduction histidine kinase